MDAATRWRLEQLGAGRGTDLDELWGTLEQVSAIYGVSLSEVLKGLEQAVKTKTSLMDLPTNQQLRKQDGIRNREK